MGKVGCEACGRFRFGPLKLADGTNAVFGHDIVPICGATENTVYNHLDHDAPTCPDYMPVEG
jgi:hypothetical protein